MLNVVWGQSKVRATSFVGVFNSIFNQSKPTKQPTREQGLKMREYLCGCVFIFVLIYLQKNVMWETLDRKIQLKLNMAKKNSLDVSRKK